MSLEDELNIPHEATLTLSPQYNLQPIELILSPTIQQNDDDDISTNFMTIPSSTTTTSQTSNSSYKVQITNTSSIRHSNTNNDNIPRCIIIGRQASVSDIRIDHKSVSRGHTALYYIIASSPSTTNITSANNTSNTNNNNTNANNNNYTKLIIQDLGGKHGTYVNDTRLSKNGMFSIDLSKLSTAEKEYRIRIGNAPLLCSLILPNEIDIDRKMDEIKQKCGEKKSVVKKDDQQNTEDVAVDYDRKEPPERINKPKALPKEDRKEPPEPKENNEDEALTRKSREEQIAAMIASFDTAPAYKKYIPTTNDEDDDNVTRGMNNLKTNGKASMKSDEGMSTSTNNNTNNNNNPYNLPITSSITLSPGSNSFTSSDGTNTPLQCKSSVSTLCFEPSGARLVAGHRDGTLRFYDFHGMQPTPQSNNTYPPFRIVDSDNDPLDQTGRHIMTALSPSATGGQWIVGNTSAQAKVLDREGQTTLYYFIKGDVYVTDPTKTTGHTASVTGVSFHPLIKDICWTTGLDGSIRQWDTSGKGRTQFQKLVCKSVIGKVKNDKGQRTQVVSNLSAHPNGRKLVIGTSCGSIQIWNCYGVNVNVNRPLGVVYSAHSGESGKGGGVTFVTFSGGNGEYIASRSDSDDTVRIWNVSSMEKDSGLFSRKHNSRGSGGKGGGEVEHSSSLLLAVCVGLPALNEFANCAFSPDGSILCAGTSVDPRKSGSGTDTCGKLKFYKLPEDNVKRIKGSKSKEGGSKSSSKKTKKTTAMLDPIVELDVAPNASVLGVQWHLKLNQIAFGTSNGM